MCVVQWVQKVSVCCVLFCRVVSVAPFLPRDPSVQRIPFIPPGGDRTIFALWELLPPGDKECKIKHVETLRAVPICEATIYRRYCLLSARHFFSKCLRMFSPWSHFSLPLFLLLIL